MNLIAPSTAGEISHKFNKFSMIFAKPEDNCYPE